MINKYIKYKNKYIKLKKFLEQTGGEGKGTEITIYMDKLKLIDTMELNNAKIYKNEKDLLVMRSDNMFLWRGFNNLNNIKLMMEPGIEGDPFRYNPIWFASPEITTLYSLRNSVTNMLKLSNSAHYNFSLNKDGSNVIDFLKNGVKLFKNSLSSVACYKTFSDYEFIDVNSSENLKILMKLYEENTDLNKYPEYLDIVLNNISVTSRNDLFKKISVNINKSYYSEENDTETDIKKKLFNFVNRLKNYLLNRHTGLIKNVAVESFKKDTQQNITEDKSDVQQVTIEKIITSKLEKNKQNNDKVLVQIKKYIISKLEFFFRKAFTFGKYKVYNNNTKQFEDRKDIGSIQNIKKDNITSVKMIRNLYESHDKSKISIKPCYNIKEINTTNILNKIVGNITDLFNKCSNQISGYISEKIKELKNKEIEYVKTNNGKFCEVYKKAQNVDSKKKMIEYEMSDNVKVIFYEQDDGSYDINIDYSKLPKEYERKYTSKEKECIFCKVISENYIEKNPVYYYGLNVTFSYYEYNPFTKQVEATGFLTNNMASKEILSFTEEKLLTVPAIHLPTRGDHKDCGEKSKTFPPDGLIHKGQPGCGAYLYADSKDSEALFYYMSIYKAVITYADKNKKNINKRCNGSAKIEEINYDAGIHPYKFLYKGENEKDINYFPYNNANSVNEDCSPTVYILFHCKVNSQPHVHAHTYIDYNDSHMSDLIKTLRGPYKSNAGGMISELFGATCYGIKKNNDPYNVWYNGEMLCDINNKPVDDIDCDISNKSKCYGQKSGWVGKNNSHGEGQMYYICSFEYLIKRIIGIKDNDDLIKKKINIKIPKEEKELQQDPVNQIKIFGTVIDVLNEKISYAKKTIEHNLLSYILDYEHVNNNASFNVINDKHEDFVNNIITNVKYFISQEYESTSENSKKQQVNLKDLQAYLTKKPNNRGYFFNKGTGLNKTPIEKKVGTYDIIGESVVISGNSLYEDKTMRVSTTIGDTFMVLFMRLACIRTKSIAGYYSSICPYIDAINPRNNMIGHPEVCVFNTADFDVKLVIDSGMSTIGFYHDKNIEDSDNFTKLLLFGYYLYYYNETNYGYVQKIDVIRQLLINEKINELNDNISKELYEIYSEISSKYKKGGSGNYSSNTHINHFKKIEPIVIQEKQQKISTHHIQYNDDLLLSITHNLNKSPLEKLSEFDPNLMDLVSDYIINIYNDHLTNDVSISNYIIDASINKYAKSMICNAYLKIEPNSQYYNLF